MKKEAKNAANWNIFCKFGQILQFKNQNITP